MIFIFQSGMFNLKSGLSTFIFILVSLTVYGQLENSKKLLAESKVKSVIEETCSGGCSPKYTEFDRNGNVIEFDFYRIGTLYRYDYDENQKLIRELWIDKLSSFHIDTILPEQRTKVETPDVNPFFETYQNDGRVLIKSRPGESKIYRYDEYCNLIQMQHAELYKIVYQEFYKYDDQQRLLESIIIDEKDFYEVNFTYKNDSFTAKVKRYTYNSKNQVTMFYKYFADPCMGFENYFMYFLNYHENGLLAGAQAYEWGETFAFAIDYEYEFY